MDTKKIIIVIPFSHTWFLAQTCLAKLKQFKTGIKYVEIVVVDSSYEWSPAINGIEKTSLFNNSMDKDILIFRNQRHSKYHATSLDYIIECFDADYLFTMETDVLICRDGWLKWYLDKMKKGIYAVGHWHGEEFVNPSATLYDMSILKKAQKEFRANKDPNMYWGKNFKKSKPVDKGFLDDVGAFSEVRGFKPDTVLKKQPTGQLRGPGWYEPGQQLYHWAVENGYGYEIVNTRHEVDEERQIPIGTFYTDRKIENSYLVHLWGGTRALDLLKHEISDPTVINNMEYWLRREGLYWKLVVPKDVQKNTIKLIKKYGWYTKQPSDREKKAVECIESIYRKVGINV